MTPLLIGVGAWVALSIPVAVAVGRAIRGADCCPPCDHDDAPDGTAGDLAADIPAECLTPAEVDERFVWLVAPLDAEIQRRWTA